MLRPTLALSFTLLLAGLCAPKEASAGTEPQTANPIREGARIFYDAGSRLFDQGMYAEALQQFDSAYRLSKSPPLLYNMAICEERLKHPRAAIVLLRRFIEQSPADEQRPAVEGRIRQLETQLAAEAAVTSPRPPTTPPEAAKPAQPGAVLDPASVPGSQPASAPSRRRFRGAWAGLALTGALGLTALGLGTYTAVHHDALRSSCGLSSGGCSLDERQHLDRTAIAADVFIGLTGAAAIGTVIAFIVEGRAGRAAERGARPTTAAAGWRF